MRPAFSSTGQAGAFALLLLVLLLLPALLGKNGLPPREQVYSSIWWGNGAFPYIDEQIYKEKGDIDIAFVGPSRIWDGIDAPYVQKMLSDKLGRPAIVRTIGWTGAGYDGLYFITQDLLQNRKVHLLVSYDSYNERDLPHENAASWFRFGDNAEALRGLPFRLQACYYFAAVIGLPRNLLNLIRSNLPADLDSPKKNYWEVSKIAENIPSRLGSVSARRGFTPTPLSESDPFETYSPLTGVEPSDVSVYSDSTKGVFQFDSTVSPWQLHFARKFANLSDEYNCRLVFLHMPFWADRRNPVIEEREFWPLALRVNMALVGIPPAKLFRGMTDAEIKKLFSDPTHLNKNGQEYFTTLITPSLLDLYEHETRR
jgi:hypothetical protein